MACRWSRWRLSICTSWAPPDMWHVTCLRQTCWVHQNMGKMGKWHPSGTIRNDWNLDMKNTTAFSTYVTYVYWKMGVGNSQCSQWVGSILFWETQAFQQNKLASGHLTYWKSILYVNQINVQFSKAYVSRMVSPKVTSLRFPCKWTPNTHHEKHGRKASISRLLIISMFDDTLNTYMGQCTVG
jgi:hypothetical protein